MGHTLFAPSFSVFHPGGLAAVSVRVVVSRVGIRQDDCRQEPDEEAEA